MKEYFPDYLVSLRFWNLSIRGTAMFGIINIISSLWAIPVLLYIFLPMLIISILFVLDMLK